MSDALLYGILAAVALLILLLVTAVKIVPETSGASSSGWGA